MALEMARQLRWAWSVMRPRLALASAVVLLAPSLACLSCASDGGIRFQVINMERPPEGLALPPADYTPCFLGEARGYDRDGNGKIDEVRITFQGRERCYGEATNHDGPIDTWLLMDESGHLVRNTRPDGGST